MPCHVFGHGQLYVTVSRVRAPALNKLKILPDISEIEGHDGKHTNSVVFRELLRKNDKKKLFLH